MNRLIPVSLFASLSGKAAIPRSEYQVPHPAGPHPVFATLLAMLAWSWVNVAMAAPPVDLQQYGRAYLAEGDTSAAAQSYAELVRINPFDPVALNNMGVAKAAGGDYQTALDLLTRAAKLAPQRLDIRENLTQLQNWLQQNHTISLGSSLPSRRTAGASTVLPEPPALWSTPLPRSQ